MDIRDIQPLSQSGVFDGNSLSGINVLEHALWYFS